MKCLKKVLAWRAVPHMSRYRGVPKFNAVVAAGSPTGFWRMSGHPAVQQALRNNFFDQLGLPRLYAPIKLNPVEPPCYGPVCPVVWEGRC
jgi:hypothetical protein